MAETDKRQAQRFRVEMPVKLAYGEGTSRDVSASGIYFMTDQYLAEGDRIRFTLEFDYQKPEEPFLLCCQGEVLRVEKHDGQAGIAVNIDSYGCAEERS